MLYLLITAEKRRRHGCHGTFACSIGPDELLLEAVHLAAVKNDSQKHKLLHINKHKVLTNKTI